MDKIQKKSLQERWISELDIEINRSLKKENWRDKNIINARWTHQPFGQTEDLKLDYRGFTFREQCHYHNLKGIDFSFSRFEQRGGFYYSILEDCLFIGATMQQTSISEKFINCDFSESLFYAHTSMANFYSCRFINAKMTDILAGNKFIDCDFTNANLSRSNHHFGVFENCIFDGAKFTGAVISSATFINTKPSDAQIASCVLAEKVKFQ